MPDKIEKKEFIVELEFNIPIKKSLIKLLSGIPTQAKDMAANRKLLSTTNPFPLIFIHQPHQQKRKCNHAADQRLITELYNHTERRACGGNGLH
jgi:hypothetical protein